MGARSGQAGSRESVLGLRAAHGGFQRGFCLWFWKRLKMIFVLYENKVTNIICSYIGMYVIPICGISIQISREQLHGGWGQGCGWRWGWCWRWDKDGDGDEDMAEMETGMGTCHHHAPRAQHTAAGFPPALCVCFCGYNSSTWGSTARQQALSLADRMAARQ